MEILVWLVGYLAVCMLVGRVIAGAEPGEAGHGPTAAHLSASAVLESEDPASHAVPSRWG